MMLVSDIYEDARSVVNFGDEDLVFSRISDAVETINSKGNFDALLGYVTVIPTGNIITLPSFVGSPLKVNIDNHPTFARDRLYEFTLNGPGSNAEQAGWTWSDKGHVPVFQQPLAPSVINVMGDVSDNGKTVTVRGISDTNEVIEQQFIIGTLSNSLLNYREITSVTKQVTLKKVTLESLDGTILATYEPRETVPEFRQIRISKTGATAYILYRAKSFRVASQNDVIPIRSKMGLLYMMKSLEAYRQERFDTAKALGDQAVQLATEEQKANDAFMELSVSSEDSTVLNLNYNNIDSLIVADIYDDAAKIVGPVGQKKLFDNLTEAISILGRKAQWDSLRGYVDISTDQYCYVTLPRYVEYVIKLNTNGYPSEMKNKWFEYHLNGPGEDWVPCDSWKDIGEVVTLHDADYSIKLRAIPDSPEDSGMIMVYGYFRGKRVMTSDDEGVLTEGAAIPIDASGNQISPVLFDRIERITKPITNGFVRLLAQAPDNTGEFTVGYYYPDETEPRYRRVELPVDSACVRIMYRRRQLKITSLTDPIHLKSKTAVLTMLQSLAALKAGKVQDATALEATAVRYLAEENSINNQSEVKVMDFGRNFTSSDQYIQC